MTDKQQIEELRKFLSQLCCISNCDNCKWRNVEEGSCLDYFEATALYNANYRQVPPNAVVLTQEEYNALMLEQKRLKEMVDRIPCGYELKDKTRKETAKEIFGKLREKSTESFLDWEGNICHLDEEYVSMREIEAVLKQYGVEVE